MHQQPTSVDDGHPLPYTRAGRVLLLGAIVLPLFGTFATIDWPSAPGAWRRRGVARRLGFIGLSRRATSRR